MVSDNHMQRGRMPLRIAVGTLLVFLAPGGASALSNDGGGSWQYSRDFIGSNPGAAPEVDDGGVGGGGRWV